MRHFSWQRFWGIIRKEFIQLKRDHPTFGMIIGIPIMQIILFGFAINSNPNNLPTAVLSADHSPFTRTLIQSLKNTGYFAITHLPKNEVEAQHLLATNQVQFVLTIPTNFSRELIRGKHPALLIEGDVTDPVATGYALAAANTLAQNVFHRELQGALQDLHPSPAPFELRTHAKYNPELITQYNILPGLLGVVLTMTMVMITAIAMTRERERGTMENLMAMPLQPLEIMLGKVTPYIMVGYLQVCIILFITHVLFRLPIVGNVGLLLLSCLPFIAVNLSVGITISTLSKNQLQATQMAVFFYLPSLLLSGFMFPFRGMPQWAQTIAELLPLTHFLRIARGILLKGNGILEIWMDLWPILAFLCVVIFFGLKRYRRTLD